MRILQTSDIHLEFEPWFPEEDADILLLCGDICVADYLTKTEASKYYPLAQRFREFFSYVTNKYEHVVLIAGNHEHYAGRFQKTIPTLRKEFPKVHILDNEYVDIGDTRIIGSTLWTDLNRGCPITDNIIRGYMADYKIIQWLDGINYRKMIPQDTRSMHLIAKQFIAEAAKTHDNCIVMTHHAPHSLSLDARFENEYYGNGAYASDLSELILDHPSIKLWFHGHVHQSKDYTIGGTRIICNPRGYIHPTIGGENEEFDQNRIIDL